MGGLGNILFQLNYAYYLSEISFDVVVCDYLLESRIGKNLKWTNHGEKSIIAEFCAYQKIRIEDGSLYEVAMIGLSKYLRKGVFGNIYLGHKLFSLNTATDINICGYFHNDVPISSSFLQQLRKDINCNLGAAFSLLLDVAKNSTLVHFRGGDYINQNMCLLGKDYYKEALRNDSHFYIVTNDINMARALFLEWFPCGNFDFLQGQNAFEDFVLLSNAKKIVLSNSTFSWWASEIGQPEMIIAPAPFFDHIKWEPQTLKSRIEVLVK